MTDSVPHHDQPSGANGHSHRLQKKPPKDPSSKHSPRLPDREPGRLQELEHDPARNVSGPRQPDADDSNTNRSSLANFKSRLPNRQSSGGFLVEGDRQKSRRLSVGSGASSKSKEKARRPATQRPSKKEEVDNAQEMNDVRHVRSTAPGTFLSNDVASGEPSGRRSVNFERQSPPSHRDSLSGRESRNKPALRSSAFHTPPQASISSAPRASTESPPIDPAQIVRMALNLSEGRRMHLDPGQVPSIQTSTDRRSVSAAMSIKARAFSGSPHHQPLDQSRDSKSQSGRGTPSGARKEIASVSSRSSGGNRSSLLEDQQPEYTFSPATVSRADRASAYFELANEHRRLLQYLPPLKHESGSSVDKESTFGRAYNPMQFVRNREARAGAKNAIDAERAGWGDASQVKHWVDAVESEAGQEGYIEGDIAHLPRWVSGTGTSTNPQSQAHQKATDENQPKSFQYTKCLWAMEPPELLADAYWLEQDDHKRLIKDRHGHMIFKAFSKPARRRAGTGLSAQTHHTAFTASSDDASKLPKSPQAARTSTASFEGPAGADLDVNGVRFSPQRKIKASAVKRHLLRRHRSPVRRNRHSSGSESDRSLDGFQPERGPKSNNIGPLERHMKQIMEKEQEGELSPVDSLADPTSPQSLEEGQRRGGVSAESPQLERHEPPSKRRSTAQSMFKFPDLGTKRASMDAPRISVEEADSDRPLSGSKANGRPKQPEQLSPGEPEHAVKRASRLGIFKRSRGDTRPATAETDFASKGRDGKGPSERRKSLASATESESESQMSRPRAGSNSFASSESLTRDDKHTGDRSPSTRHVFKSGRISEIIRSEKPDPRLRDPPQALRSREYLSSDTDDTRSRIEGGRRRKQADSGGSSPVQRNRRPSSTSQSPSKPPRTQYHISNLPSFKPSNISPGKERGTFLSPYDDHITRQQRERRLQRKQSRFSDLAPPSLDTSDVSPNTSTPDLSRTATRTSKTTEDKSSRGIRSGYDSGSGSERAGSKIQSAAQRLNDALGTPGILGKGTLPPTGLSSLDPRRDPGRGRQESQQSRDKPFKAPVSPRKHESHEISRRNIAHVRTLLLAAGVKASTIVERANTPREKLPVHIVKALQTVGKGATELGQVTRQQEHVVAARLLSSNLQSSMSTFDNSAVTFRNKTCHELNVRIDDLRDLVSNHLTHQVHEEGDRADGFVAQLTTTHTLNIKQVNDSVDLMMRKRRQRLRWMRQAGFGVLEWVLVGIMWEIWVVVLIVSTVKKCIWFFVGIMRWLLFLD